LADIDAFDKAYEILQRAISYMGNADAKLRGSWVWSDVVDGLVKIGRFSEATNLAKRIEDRETRLRALTRVVDGTTSILCHVLSVMMDVGEDEKAIELAMKSNDERVLFHIVRLLADAGKLEEALKVAEKMHYENRDYALSYIADAAVKVGELDKAISIARSISLLSADLRWKTLASLAQQLALLGAVDRALELADEVKDARQRAQVLTDVAFATTESGNEDGVKRVLKYAFHAARKIENSIERAWALLDLANVIVTAGIQDFPVILARMWLILPDEVGPAGGELRLSLEVYEDIGAMSVDLSAWLEHLELDRPVLRFRSLRAGVKRKRKVKLRPKRAGEFTLPIDIRLSRAGLSLEPSAPCVKLRVIM